MLRRFLVVVGLLVGLLAPAAAAQAVTLPAGCTMTGTLGTYRVVGAAPHNLIDVATPVVQCQPRGTYALKSTFQLQRYYVTAKVWKTERTLVWQTYATSALNENMPCVTSGALMRAVITWRWWSVALRKYVQTTTLVGVDRAICS